MGENRHLPESELDIMLVVWGAGGPVSAPAILEGLERPLTASALHSYLKRLEEKGFLSCKKAGKVNTYTAMVAREDYQRSEGESFLKKLYGSSISRFAAALYDGKRLEPGGLWSRWEEVHEEYAYEPAELEELQALLDRLSGGEET